MRKIVLASFAAGVLVGGLFGATSLAQEPQSAAANGTSAPTPATPAITITAETTPKELARAAFMAQGGEKFRAVQNMMLRGSVQLYPPNSVQSIPGSFSLVTAGDKLRMEIDAQRSKLAAIQTNNTRAKQAVKESFVSGYRATVWIAVALAAASAASAAILLSSQPAKIVRGTRE